MGQAKVMLITFMQKQLSLLKGRMQSLISSKKQTIDEEENEANMMRQGAAHGPDKSIVSFAYKPNELNLPGCDQTPLETTIKEAPFKLRLASSGQRFERANQLIQERFSWRGYSTTELNLNRSPNRITLIIEQGDDTVGTITLVVDAPLDLEVDQTFKAEVDLLRAGERRLAEVTNLAMQGGPSNKRSMAAILHLTYIFARHIHGCTDFVIEVNHRHSRYYERMLGFKRCGTERHRAWANEQTVLLCLDLDHMEKQIEKLGGTMEAYLDEKSLYPYFFTKQDEDGIAQRLRPMSRG